VGAPSVERVSWSGSGRSFTMLPFIEDSTLTRASDIYRVLITNPAPILGHPIAQFLFHCPLLRYPVDPFQKLHIF